MQRPEYLHGQWYLRLQEPNAALARWSTWLPSRSIASGLHLDRSSARSVHSSKLGKDCVGLLKKCNDSPYSGGLGGDERLHDALECTSALVGEGLEVCPPVTVLVIFICGRLF